MESISEEFILLIRNKHLNPDVKMQAWENILALTGSEEGIAYLSKEKKLILFIASYITEEKDPTYLKVALKCLINVSSDAVGAAIILSSSRDFVRRLLGSLSDPQYEFTEETTYILSNVSRHCNLFDTQDVSEHVSTLLRDLYLGYDNVDGEIRRKYRFVALFLANFSKNAQARRLLLEDGGFLKQFIRPIDPNDPDERRLGVSLTLQNLCLETDAHTKLLEETELLPVLLLPLMGGEEYDEEEMSTFPIDCQYLESSKQLEKLPQVRRALVQALSLLCYTEKGWTRLKDANVYRIVQKLHLQELDDAVQEAVETLVSFLMIDKYSSAQELKSTTLPPEATDVVQDIPNFVITSIFH